MEAILLVEPDAGTAQRIAGVLESQGWTVVAVVDRQAALQQASARAPHLVLANAAVPEVRQLLGTFSRGRGGPGAVVLLPEVSSASADDFGADEAVREPLSADKLQEVVRRCLSRPRGARRKRRGDSEQLTAAEIFGDLLSEEQRAAFPQKPATGSAAAEDDVARKLEETLSGVLQPSKGATKGTGAASKPRRQKTDDIDTLLTRTLSSLDIPTSPQRSDAPAAKQADPASAPAAAPEAPEAGTDLPGEAAATPSGAAAAPTEPPPAEPAAAAAAGDAPAGSLQLDPPPPPPPLEEPAVSPAEQPPPEVSENDENEGQTFGEYTLLDRIAVGGMAEVWKARRRGVEGFQKTVAIKRILSHLTDSSEFVTMFIDEAKLAAQLNHDNIIQIYDLGKVGEDFFIAMEHVEGRDLRSILSAAQRAAQPMSPGLVLLIAARLARALHYAHRKKDFEERALGLVHRDVSPQNVLISYEGEIKLCDFGIVKAVAKASSTQMGSLKGKLQYMSPEQAWGRSVDPRSDLFSLGAVLFEALTGRKLFSAESEMGVLEAVREARTPDFEQLPDPFPSGVVPILRRALAKDPADRFQTAGEMEQELEKILYAFRPAPSQSELAGYMHRLFLDGTPSEAAVARGRPEHRKTGASARLTAGFTPPKPPPRRRGRALVLAAILAALLGGGGALAYYFWSQRGESSPPVPPPEVVATPPPPVEPPADGADTGAAGTADTATSEATEPAADPTAAAATPPPTAADGATEAGVEAAAGLTPKEIEQRVQDELDRRAERLRRSFESDRQRLQQELDRVQEELREPPAPPPPDDEGGGG